MALKTGRVLAAGKPPETLTADLLFRACAARVTLRRSGGRYAMDVVAKRRVVV